MAKFLDKLVIKEKPNIRAVVTGGSNNYKSMKLNCYYIALTPLHERNS